MEEKRKEFLPMYGGIWGGMVPLAILIVGLVWLSVAERGGTKPFWACGWLALAGGLFFAKDKAEYCKAAMRGIGNQTGMAFCRCVWKNHGCRRAGERFIVVRHVHRSAGRHFYDPCFYNSDAFFSGYGNKYGNMPFFDSGIVSRRDFSRLRSRFIGNGDFIGSRFWR